MLHALCLSRLLCLVVSQVTHFEGPGIVAVAECCHPIVFLRPVVSSLCRPGSTSPAATPAYTETRGGWRGSFKNLSSRKEHIKSHTHTGQKPM